MQPSQQLHIWKSSTPLQINWTIRNSQLDISSTMEYPIQSSSSSSFQQDGATSHTSHAIMAEIQSFFGDRVISKGLCPPRSPDLTPPDCSLRGLMEGTVCHNKPRNTDALKANITEEIQTVTADVLARTFPKYGAQGSILSVRKLWPLPARVMVSSHFLHKEACPLQISLQYPH